MVHQGRSVVRLFDGSVVPYRRSQAPDDPKAVEAPASAPKNNRTIEQPNDRT